MVVKRKAVLAAVGALLAWGPCLASAEQTLDPNAVELAEVKAQLGQIQQENKALREQVGRLLTRMEALERTGEHVVARSKEAPPAQAMPIETALERAVGPPAFVDVPHLQIRGFADTQVKARWTDSEQSNTFVLGAVDFYATSEVTDQVSVLVEADFNSDTENAATYRLERALVKYAFSDLLNVTMGRMHVPVGYWNPATHHGNWLDTTIARPDIALHEAENGAFIPVHQIGIDLSGVQEFSGVDLGYNVGLFNGRGRTVTEVQHVKDKNDGKAVNLRVSLKPHAIEGLTVGGNVWFDEIPSNPPTAARREAINELIIGEYATYFHDNVELIGELFNIYHDEKTSGEEFDTVGLYLQGGYRIEKWMPYYRFDYIDVANSDPFYTTPRNLDRIRHTLGVRWDFLPWNAVKVEYGLLKVDQGDDEQALQANWSFAF